jgi:hypothetical protein
MKCVCGIDVPNIAATASHVCVGPRGQPAWPAVGAADPHLLSALHAIALVLGEIRAELSAFRRGVR